MICDRYLPRPSWVMPRATLTPFAGTSAELDGVVGLGEDGLGQVFADLVLVDVDGGHELDVLDVVAAQDGVHEAGHEVGLLGVLVELDALHERRGAVADTDDRDAHWIAQDKSTSTASAGRPTDVDRVRGPDAAARHSANGGEYTTAAARARQPGALAGGAAAGRRLRRRPAAARLAAGGARAGCAARR